MKSSTKGSNTGPSSAADERILTLHPEGKQGVNILLSRYGQMSLALESELAKAGELPLADLLERVRRKLKGTFDGSITWYFTVVKLDLQARKRLEIVPGKGPQRVRLQA